MSTILVPPPKPPRFEPPYSPWRGAVRALGVTGFLLFLVLGAMVMTENKVPWPITVFELVGAGFLALLLAWRLELLGGLLLTGSMVLAIIWLPPSLDTWRPWFLALEVFLGLVGVLLVLLPRSHS